MARLKIVEERQETPRRPRSVSARSSGKTNPHPKQAVIDGIVFPLSDVFYGFFPFVAERQAIHKRRLAGEPQPWTEDPILQQYPFTNVFRVLDRNTQFILNDVIGKGSQDLYDMFFRVALFRTFNKPETYRLLERKLGPLTWKSFNIEKYERVLGSARIALYSNSYIIPAPNLGYKSNYSNHLRMIETMIAVDNLPTELKKLKHLKDAHGRIEMYQSMGDFTAMQLVIVVFFLVCELTSSHTGWCWTST